MVSEAPAPKAETPYTNPGTYSDAALTPSTDAPPTYQKTTGQVQRSHFNIHSSAFLRKVEITGPGVPSPSRAEYYVEVGWGFNGKMVLRRGLSKKGAPLAAAGFKLHPLLIKLCTGDPRDQTDDSAWLDVSDQSRGNEYTLQRGTGSVTFRRTDPAYRSRFRLVDDASATLLAEFCPGPGRDHALDIYGPVDPELERWTLLLAAIIALRMALMPQAPGAGAPITVVT